MRQLIASINVTLDGYMAGPNCELDWHFKYWTEDIAEAMTKQMAQADTILLGRNTYMGMSDYWQRRDSGLSVARGDIAFAHMLNTYRKVVCSKTITTLPWQNTTLLHGNLRSAITDLKQEAGSNIMLYGSRQLAGTLARMQLIDCYRLWVHPVVLGKGKTLFTHSQPFMHLRLRHTQQFKNGVMACTYSTT